MDAEFDREINRVLTQVAKDQLQLTSLHNIDQSPEDRKRFYLWDIRRALLDAYLRGFKDGKDGVCDDSSSQ